MGAGTGAGSAKGFVVVAPPFLLDMSVVPVLSDEDAVLVSDLELLGSFSGRAVNPFVIVGIKPLISVSF